MLCFYAFLSVARCAMVWHSSSSCSGTAQQRSSTQIRHGKHVFRITDIVLFCLWLRAKSKDIGSFRVRKNKKRKNWKMAVLSAWPVFTVLPVFFQVVVKYVLPYRWMTRGFRCDDLDTPHGYIPTKIFPTLIWPPKGTFWVKIGPFRTPGGPEEGRHHVTNPVGPIGGS